MKLVRRLLLFFVAVAFFARGDATTSYAQTNAGRPPADVDLFDDLPPRPAVTKERRSTGADDAAAGEDVQLSGSKSRGAQLKRHLSLATKGLEVGESADVVEQHQQAVVEELKKLLGGASEGGSSSANSPKDSPSATTGPAESRPLPSSREPVGNPERDASAEKEMEAVGGVPSYVWGHLPAKVREALRNAREERFLPKYERQLTEYYRRLATERSSSP